MRIRALLVAVALILATAAAAEATSIQINTDGTWLAKNALPGAGWDTNVLFDETADTGWINASNNGFCAPFDDKGCRIWYDGSTSTTMQAWFRDTFFIDGPIVSAFLSGGADDDARVMINGTVFYNVFDSVATTFGPINIASALHQGTNLIAVFAQDASSPTAPQHGFHARLTIETQSPTPVPEPTSLVLLGSGLSAWVMRKRRGAVRDRRFSIRLPSVIRR